MASGGSKETDGSDEEVIRPAVKNKKKSKQLLSSASEEDSDLEIKSNRKPKPLSYESEDMDSLDETAKDSNASKKIGSECLTDISDNEQSDKCSICLSKFLGQDIATPETCDHVFCLECLQEWSKNVNTCPIDRLKFNLILIRHHKEEKIIRTIFVNNSELPYNSESESNTESQVNYCEMCGEDENEGTLLLCHDCQKFYHFGCVIPIPNNSYVGSWQCPACDSCVRLGEKILRDVHRMLQGISRRFRGVRHFNLGRPVLAGSSHSLRSQPSSVRDLNNRFLYQKSIRRSILSTSESSDEEIEQRTASSRLYQTQVTSVGSSKSRCALMSTKRRNEIISARNRRLVSTAAAAATTTNSEDLYAADSDEGYSDFRLSSPVPENFDLVGSILQSQSLLHSPEVLKVSRDGSVLKNSKNSSNQSTLRPDASPIHTSGESSRSSSPYSNSSVHNDNKSPFINNAVGKQIPTQSTQNTTSKYSEISQQNYACGSSVPRERSLSYDECIVSGSTYNSGSSNDRYNNDPNSTIVQKGFCCPSTSDDIKKTNSNKDSKSHHSEEEVDIYSDIESVGEEDNSLSDKLEPPKIAYKCEESQQSDTNDVSDSTDNELVIDEDMPAEEENIKHSQESQGFELMKSDDNIQNSNENVNDCDEDIENDYSNSSFPSNDNYDSGKTSDKHSSPNINLDSKNSNVQNHESFTDNEAQESDVDMQEDENSLDSTRKSYPDCGSNSCSAISSPKSTAHFDNSNLNESLNVESENQKCTSENPNINLDNTNDSSHMEYFNENNSNISGNISPVEQPYKHKKYNFSIVNERKCTQNSSENFNENSQTDPNSNSSFNQDISAKEKVEYSELTVSQSENSSHFSFTSANENIERTEQEDVLESNDSNCDEVHLNSEEKNVPKDETEESMDTTDITQTEHLSNDNFSNCKQIIELEENIDSNENTHSDNISHFGSVKQTAEGSDMEDLTDSNSAIPQSLGVSTVTTETINICNDETVKSDNEFEDCDSIEEASTPCLDENLEGEIENSPPRNESFENDNQEFPRTSDNEYENEDKGDQSKDNNTLSDDIKEDNVDLGIEDISEAGSEDLDEFPEEDGKDDCESANKKQKRNLSEDSNNCYQSNVNQDFEDQEEGEIIEEKPIVESDRKNTKHDRYYDDRHEYEERNQRMSISDLPRIPKLKRNRDRDVIPEPMHFDTKRNSVLGRIDLGAGDVSWKRLSKHTKERSYRDGRPKDERLLYRERESRDKDRKNSDSLRRNESKNRDRKREERKKNDRSKSDSRSRKSEKTKEIEWSYSDRDKRRSHKEHKDRHSKEKHSKERKDRHDKSRHSKDETKYDREKIKDDARYERETRYDKEERYERLIYEKDKSKDHKNKRKDRKSESTKSNKDHSREKHKHTHVSETFLDKQREREVRKIDDKLKIVVEQKEKEKLKNKEKKEKYEKELFQRKHENERKAYSEMTSIESKEIFTKGDSIIINVNFNRSSPKDSSASNATDTQIADQNLLEELDDDSLIEETKVKSKDKSKSSLETASVKRPITPPERPNQVLSVSESYWKGGDDPDENNSVTSEKSEENIPNEDENDTMESRDDTNNFTSNSNSSDVSDSQEGLKEEITEAEIKSTKSEEITDISKEESFTSKRRSPRSPSPPSPADNDSYDPCEPTKSPSPPPIPVAPPLPLSNPKPPPSPELPPLPPEPEPNDLTQEEPHTLQNSAHDFNASAIAVSSAIQPVTAETQTQSTPAFTGMMLPPPNFLSQTPNSLPNISSLLPPRTLSFSVNNANVLGSNHMPPGLGGNFINSQMHTGNALPPPPNPPNMSHMTSVPPPPPPPTMGLMSQVRTSQISIQPPLPPNSFLQNLNMSMSIPQLQLPPLPHLPPNLCAALANHQSSFVSQNQSTTLPCSVTNQGSRFMLPPGQIPLIPNQNMTNSNKPHISIAQMLSHCQTIPVNSVQKSDQPSTPAEKNEVIDMEVDSPYSPGDCSIDSVNDYSPTGSPLPSTPKESGDIFDTLFSADVRTSEKRTNDTVTRSERSKSHSGSKSTGETPSKKSKHEHRDSKGRHSVRMQIEKNKKARKEQKLAEKLSKLDDSQLKILDELPNSAVEMQVKEKFLKKLNRQERVVEEVKLSLKPYYKSRDVSKEEYKDILRRAVPKICHNKSGEINPVKVKYLVECYVKKAKHSRKKSDKKKSKFS